MEFMLVSVTPSIAWTIASSCGISLRRPNSELEGCLRGRYAYVGQQTPSVISILVDIKSAVGSFWVSGVLNPFSFFLWAMAASHRHTPASSELAREDGVSNSQRQVSFKAFWAHITVRQPAVLEPETK